MELAESCIVMVPRVLSKKNKLPSANHGYEFTNGDWFYVVILALFLKFLCDLLSLVDFLGSTIFSMET